MFLNRTEYFRLLTDGQSEARVDGAAVGGLVVIGLEVGISAGGVASLADGRGALGVIGGHGETELGEFRVGAHVDAGQIPEDSRASLSVLEL